jgi:hypothetical protein
MSSQSSSFYTRDPASQSNALAHLFPLDKPKILYYLLCHNSYNGLGSTRNLTRVREDSPTHFFELPPDGA